MKIGRIGRVRTAIGKSAGSILSLVVVITMILALAAPMGASAAENKDLPDLDAEGSITVTLKNPKSGKPLGSENKFTLYKVADVTTENGYKFVYTEDFAEAGTAPAADSEMNANLASKLMKIAKNGAASIDTASAGSDGKISFGGLKVGLYLIVQSAAGTGDEKYAVDPFLVTIPMRGTDGTLIYNVDATAKVGITPPKNPPKPPTPHRPPRLPQTGQLWWPVFVGAAAGVILLAAGILNKNKNGNR